jgi:hypothetical protein
MTSAVLSRAKLLKRNGMARSADFSNLFAMAQQDGNGHPALNGTARRMVFGFER